MLSIPSFENIEKQMMNNIINGISGKSIMYIKSVMAASFLFIDMRGLSAFAFPFTE